MISSRAVLFCGFLFHLGACNGPEMEEADHAQQTSALRHHSHGEVPVAMAQRTALKGHLDSADLQPGARLVLQALAKGGWRMVPRSVPLAAKASTLYSLPTSVRVWRRSFGGNNSCTGQVDVVPMEEYVKGVLPNEWIASWDDESLKAGAVAIRTYASAWIHRGGKYDCADLCDTTYSQVYDPMDNARSARAVDDTSDEIVIIDGEPVFAEYSAENGNPTLSGVDDSVCNGKSLYGHGRGMCQWGSQRWATQGKDYQWIVMHYYPGSSWNVVVEQEDGGVEPPPETDSHVPQVDSDAGTGRVDPLPGNDWGLLEIEAGPAYRGAPGNLSGGCSVADPGGDQSLALLLGLLLMAAFITRRRPR